jgi:hypothetical protein
VLRRIFGSKRGEMIGGWRKFSNEELHNLYSSPNVIRMSNSRRIRRAGHVERMAEKLHIGFWCKPRRKETSRDT